VAMGACVIEKHFTLDRTLPGPDHQASAEPDELRSLVRGIRRVESALGDGVKKPVPGEIPNIPVARKSAHWRHSLKAGTVVGADDIIALRPGTGVAPEKISSLVGRRLLKSVQEGEMVSEEDFEPTPKSPLPLGATTDVVPEGEDGSH
ncbi:MAG TPA: N-acetylneuraminate synthase family protein, partial [Thermoguttaceae bacterium]